MQSEARKIKQGGLRPWAIDVRTKKHSKKIPALFKFKNAIASTLTAIKARRHLLFISRVKHAVEQ